MKYRVFLEVLYDAPCLDEAYDLANMFVANLEQSFPDVEEVIEDGLELQTGECS